MARERRTKKEIISAKMGQLDVKIAAYTKKIAELNAQQDALQKQLDTIAAEEKRAAEEAKVKEVVKLMKKKGISAEELAKLVEEA